MKYQTTKDLQVQPWAHTGNKIKFLIPRNTIVLPMEGTYVLPSSTAFSLSGERDLSAHKYVFIDKDFVTEISDKKIKPAKKEKEKPRLRDKLKKTDNPYLVTANGRLARLNVNQPYKNELLGESYNPAMREWHSQMWDNDGNSLVPESAQLKLILIDNKIIEDQESDDYEIYMQAMAQYVCDKSDYIWEVATKTAADNVREIIEGSLTFNDFWYDRG